MKCYRLLLCSLFLLLPQSIHAQGLDLSDLNLGEEEAPVEDVAEDMDPGDNKSFTVSTDVDISLLEVDDTYKNNNTVFKVTEIKSKGKDGGKFTVERIFGDGDPNLSWTRTSGLGPPSIRTSETLLDLYLAAGPAMHFIALCLLLTIIVGLNSAWIYRRDRQCPVSFVDPALDALQAENIKQFRSLAKQESGLFPHICRAMTARFDGSTLDDISARCQIEAGKQIRLMRAPLTALKLIAAVAPMLGLLGTVMGMVACFESVAYEAASAAKSQTLAAGIRVALFTTVGGLSVAIPTMFVYFMANLKLNGIISECETLTEQFVHEIALIKRQNGDSDVAKPRIAETEVAEV